MDYSQRSKSSRLLVTLEINEGVLYLNEAILLLFRYHHRLISGVGFWL